jgi:hypothetical protein
LGGNDTKENLIKLTNREHYIAHLILWKCGYKEMSEAFSFMLHSDKKYINRLTSKQYARLTEENNEIKRKRLSGKNSPMFGVRLCGTNNPFYGKHHSDETKELLRQLQKGKKLSKKAKQDISKRMTGGNHYSAVKVKCIETGEIFGCKVEASKKMYGKKSLRDRITKSIKKKKSVEGFTWELVKC